MKKVTVVSLFLALFLVACGQKTPTTQQPITPNNQPVLNVPTLPSTMTPFVPLDPTPTVLPSNTPTALPTSTATPIAYGPDNFPANVDPLTGLVVTDTKLLDRLPMAVKVNVTDRYSNRPPWGLSFADIVYDYYHNGGVSRYHAIFYGQDADLIGPIRSARMLDDYLIQAYKSVFAFGHATAELRPLFDNSTYANRLIEEGATVVCPPSGATPMCRYEPNGVDLLLTGTKALTDWATNKGLYSSRPDLNGMAFNAATPSGGEQGKQLFMRYSFANYKRWDYDPATGRYLLFIDASNDTGGGETFEPLKDRLTDKQIGADNVVVLIVDDEYAQRPPNEIVQINLIGSGPAYAFRDGKVYKVTWNHPNKASIVYLTNPDGTPFDMKPGKTWIQVSNTSGTAEQQDDGSWRFVYHILP